MIREAAMSDFDEIYSLLVLMHGESRYRVFDINPEKLKSFAKSMILDSSKITLVAEEGDGIAGIFMAVIGEMYFSDCRAAADRIFYVHPDFRRKGIGSLLANKYIQLAKDEGANDIQLSTSTGLPVDAIAKISESHDMIKVGESYRFNYVR